MAYAIIGLKRAFSLGNFDAGMYGAALAEAAASHYIIHDAHHAAHRRRCAADADGKYDAAGESPLSDIVKIIAFLPVLFRIKRRRYQRHQSHDRHFARRISQLRGQH